MPRPMKVKMFMDAKPSTRRANQCLAGKPQFSNHHKIGNSDGDNAEAHRRNLAMRRRDHMV
jgi:hypothetical protein